MRHAHLAGRGDDILNGVFDRDDLDGLAATVVNSCEERLHGSRLAGVCRTAKYNRPLSANQHFLNFCNLLLAVTDFLQRFCVGRIHDQDTDHGMEISRRVNGSRAEPKLNLQAAVSFMLDSRVLHLRRLPCRLLRLRVAMHAIQTGTNVERCGCRDDRLLDPLAENAVKDLANTSLAGFDVDVTCSHQDGCVDEIPCDFFNVRVALVAFILNDLVLVVKYANDLSGSPLPFTNTVVVIFQPALQVKHGVHRPRIRSHDARDRLIAGCDRRIAVFEGTRDTSLFEVKILSGGHGRNVSDLLVDHPCEGVQEITAQCWPTG